MSLRLQFHPLNSNLLLTPEPDPMGNSPSNEDSDGERPGQVTSSQVRPSEDGTVHEEIMAETLPRSTVDAKTAAEAEADRARGENAILGLSQ